LKNNFSMFIYRKTYNLIAKDNNIIL